MKTTSHINNTTKSKKVYIDKWNNYLNSLYLLCWVNDKSLSDEIKQEIDKIKGLVLRAAEDKGLK